MPWKRVSSNRKRPSGSPERREGARHETVAVLASGNAGKLKELSAPRPWAK